jgi:hypothetical protein
MESWAIPLISKDGSGVRRVVGIKNDSVWLKSRLDITEMFIYDAESRTLSVNFKKVFFSRDRLEIFDNYLRIIKCSDGRRIENEEFFALVKSILSDSSFLGSLSSSIIDVVIPYFDDEDLDDMSDGITLSSIFSEDIDRRIVDNVQMCAKGFQRAMIYFDYFRDKDSLSNFDSTLSHLFRYAIDPEVEDGLFLSVCPVRRTVEIINCEHPIILVPSEPKQVPVHIKNPYVSSPMEHSSVVAVLVWFTHEFKVACEKPGFGVSIDESNRYEFDYAYHHSLAMTQAIEYLKDRYGRVPELFTLSYDPDSTEKYPHYRFIVDRWEDSPLMVTSVNGLIKNHPRSTMTMCPSVMRLGGTLVQLLSSMLTALHSNLSDDKIRKHYVTRLPSSIGTFLSQLSSYPADQRKLAHEFILAIMLLQYDLSVSDRLIDYHSRLCSILFPSGTHINNFQAAWNLYAYFSYVLFEDNAKFRFFCNLLGDFLNKNDGTCPIVISQRVHAMLSEFQEGSGDISSGLIRIPFPNNAVYSIEQCYYSVPKVTDNVFALFSTIPVCSGDLPCGLNYKVEAFGVQDIFNGSIPKSRKIVEPKKTSPPKSKVITPSFKKSSSISVKGSSASLHDVKKRAIKDDKNDVTNSKSFDYIEMDGRKVREFKHYPELSNEEVECIISQDENSFSEALVNYVGRETESWGDSIEEPLQTKNSSQSKVVKPSGSIVDHSNEPVNVGQSTPKADGLMLDYLQVATSYLNKGGHQRSSSSSSTTNKGRFHSTDNYRKNNRKRYFYK